MAMVTSAALRSSARGAPAPLAPAQVPPEDLDDLATFFGLDREACRRRLAAYSMGELADRWNEARPETPEQITEFYRHADLYVWELLQWHASPVRRPHWEALARAVELCAPASGRRGVLDFGCGVGTDALYLAEAGYDVTLMDVDGPAFRFARHRFGRRGLPARFAESRWPLPPLGGPYDMIVCFDVFEHLPDPLGAAAQLVRALRPGGLLVQYASFQDEGVHPCHLRANIRRFNGVRWHIGLGGLGLRAETSLIYRKGGRLLRAAQRARFLFWRATWIWPVVVPPRSRAG